LLLFQTFNGNKDEDTTVTNSLACPITAKCVRLIPLTWNNNISMRMDLKGCHIRKTPKQQTSSAVMTTTAVPVTTTTVAMTTTTVAVTTTPAPITSKSLYDI